VKKDITSQPIPLRVLGYEEDGEWLAHCLETDLVGTGSDFEEALAALRELTEMQLSFALSRGQLSLFHRPAPTWVIETYSRAVDEALEQLGSKPRKLSTRRVSTFNLPRNPGSAKFALANA